MERFITFRLPRLLPSGHVLAWNTAPYSMQSYVFTQMSGSPYGLVAQQQTTSLETSLIVSLLNAYPEYATHEMLLEAMNGDTLEQAHKRLQTAIQERTLDTLMKPIRTVLARCRLKLEPFQLDIRSVHGEGYLLIARSPHEQDTNA